MCTALWKSCRIKQRETKFQKKLNVNANERSQIRNRPSKGSTANNHPVKDSQSYYNYYLVRCIFKVRNITRQYGIVAEPPSLTKSIKAVTRRLLRSSNYILVFDLSYIVLEINQSPTRFNSFYLRYDLTT